MTPLPRYPGAILALESSCDETAAALVRGGRVVAHRLATQFDLHAKWGGVVPEAAARAHLENFLPVIEETLEAAGTREFDAVAVTARPGLVGALSIGTTLATGIAVSRGLPLLGINHLEGHVWSVLAAGEPDLPMVCLLVSGGHTETVLVRGLGDYQVLGATMDDAAGEAFDKSARAMGLPAPGGLSISRLALEGDDRRYPLPRGLKRGTLDFSFAGLKTEVLRTIERAGRDLHVPSLAASLQRTIVEVLVERTFDAVDRTGARTFGLVGGVASNALLRARVSEEGERRGVRVLIPPPDLCTDNAAMIGLAASLHLARGAPTLDVEASSHGPLEEER